MEKQGSSQADLQVVAEKLFRSFSIQYLQIQAAVKSFGIVRFSE